MFKFFTGTVHSKLQNNSYIINNPSFGLEIFSPYPLEVNDPVTFYIHHEFSTDYGFSFFGFHTIEELHFFQTLISVPGLGAKTTIKLISQLGFATIGSSIHKKDSKSFTIVSGIGTKIANRIVTDLQNKIPIIFLGSDYELMSTLITIGYNQRDVLAIINSIDGNLSLEKRIQSAISLLSMN